MISGEGRWSNGAHTPSSWMHLRAGTSAVNSAPLKFTSGALLTAPEVGAVEFLTDTLYFTSTTGPTRYQLARILSATAVLDFPATSARSSSDLTIALAGAALGDTVILGVPNGSVVANTCYTAFVSTANTVVVRFNNYDNASLDPVSGTFKVTIVK